MTVIHILMEPQYLTNSHVLRNNVSPRLIVPRRTMVRNYVRRDMDTQTDVLINSQSWCPKLVSSIPVKAICYL